MGQVASAAGDCVVLVVEDDEDHAFLVRRGLSGHLGNGLRVVHARTLAVATDRLAEGGVDCVLLDLSLPDASGLTGLRALAEHHAEVPVVVLTGSDDENLGIVALADGAQDYLVKGQTDPAGLARAVRFAIERVGRQRAEQAQVDLSAQFRSVVESCAEGLCGLDDHGRVVYLNPSAVALLGWSAAQAAGQGFHDLVHPPADPPADCPGDCVEGSVCSLRAVLSSQLGGDLPEVTIRTRAGESVCVSLRRRPLAGGSGSVVTFLDVTAQRSTVRALAVRETQLTQVHQAAGLGSWDWDPSSGMTRWSAEVRAILGASDAELPDGLASPEIYARVVHPQDVPDVASVLARIVEHPEACRRPAEFEHRVLDPHGGQRWIACRVAAVPDEGSPRGIRVIGTAQDVTDRKAAAAALAYRGLYDGLTALPNRVLFADRLAAALDPAHAKGGLTAVLFGDLDRFTRVNDSLGHAAGDRLLQRVAREVRAALPDDDILARFGGDEFVVLHAGARDLAEVRALAERVADAAARTFPVGQHHLQVCMSIGIAVARAGEPVDPESMLRDADAALARAKRSGRGGVEVFDAAMRHQAVSRLATENDLRAGLERGEVVAYYQPVVDLATGEVTGVEALARWRHPQRGLLLPGEFIPVAEETGLIVALDTGMLEQASAQVVDWNAARSSPLHLSINVAARELDIDLLPRRVAHVLAGSGLDPGLLCLELTESGLLHPGGAETLAALRALGVRLAVDDFGTGYSSLAYLERLTVDVLKVDRSFVAGLGSGPRAAPLLSAIIAMARALGLQVVAEGVETAAQLEFLRARGVASGQGFLWGEAVHPQQATWASGAPASTPRPRADSRAARIPGPRALAPADGLVVGDAPVGAGGGVESTVGPAVIGTGR